MSEDKVIWLSKHRPQTPITTVRSTAERSGQFDIEVLTCNCGNKTFALVYTGDTFPKLQCVVCGTAHGHLGWVDHESHP